jgi:hypothetical protein
MNWEGSGQKRIWTYVGDDVVDQPALPFARSFYSLPLGHHQRADILR